MELGEGRISLLLKGTHVKTLQLKAPAKVNYRLDVIRRRPDGYHDLRMIMQRIDLCDDIMISTSDVEGVRVTCGATGVPEGQENIAWRAADAILRCAGRRDGVDIRITKRIPVAAGLGGGSSDAATVLMGLNELLGLGFSRERLMEIGVALGADVPFFIFMKTALAEGIGEVLTAIDRIPPAWLVIVNPNLRVSTAWVYQNLKLTDRINHGMVPRFFDDLAALCRVLSNDLEAVTLGRFPVIREIKEQLVAHGALGALMSGSGPTVFGVFPSESAARQVVVEIAKSNDWFVAAVPTL